MPRGMRVDSANRLQRGVHLKRLLSILLIVFAGCAPTAAPPKQSSKPRQESPSLALPKLVQSDATFPELERAHREHHTLSWVDGGGTITRILRDDKKRPRHQRFVVKIGSGANAFTVLVAHNIDLAPRVPIKKGEEITFHGEYIWNEQGGTVHWTHEDPKHEKEGGWIRYKDRVYE